MRKLSSTVSQRRETPATLKTPFYHPKFPNDSNRREQTEDGTFADQTALGHRLLRRSEDRRYLAPQQKIGGSNSNCSFNSLFSLSNRCINSLSSLSSKPAEATATAVSQASLAPAAARPRQQQHIGRQQNRPNSSSPDTRRLSSKPTSINAFILCRLSRSEGSSVAERASDLATLYRHVSITNLATLLRAFSGSRSRMLLRCRHLGIALRQFPSTC